MSEVGLLEVVAVGQVTPRMRRITFTGAGLSELGTWPDQQLKLCFPRTGQDAPRLPELDADDEYGMRWYQTLLAIPEDERPWLRSYTVRRLSGGTLDVDFVLHDHAGPATRWALTAKPGDVLGRYGPSAAYASPLGAGDWYLFAGDETALPAVGTLLESLPAGARAVCYLDVAGAEEEQSFDSAADVTVHWSYRGLLDAVRGAEFPPGGVFAWLAGEAGLVRSLRRHLVDERGVPKTSIDFTGYWRPRHTQDDAPSDADVTDAQELLAARQARRPMP